MCTCACRFSQRPGKCTRSSGAGVSGGFEVPDLGARNWLIPLQKQQVLLTTKPSAASLFFCMFVFMSFVYLRYVCVRVLACVYRSTSTWLGMAMEARGYYLRESPFDASSTLTFEGVSQSNAKLSVLTNLLRQLSRGICYFYLEKLAWRVACPAHLALVQDLGILNSGPQVCMSSTLTTEPSSLLCIILYKSYLKPAPCCGIYTGFLMFVEKQTNKQTVERYCPYPQKPLKQQRYYPLCFFLSSFLSRKEIMWITKMSEVYNCDCH